MAEKRYTPQRFIPTTSRSGNDSPSLFRLLNMWLRGRGTNLYAECVRPPLDLDEDIPAEAITGTITFSTASRTVTGSGTSFQSELGHFLQTVAGELIIVDEIISDTEFLAETVPLTAEMGVAVYRLPVLFEIGKKRGTLLSGNAFEGDKGTILCVGIGTLRVNGDELNATLVADPIVKIAIYDPVTDSYTIHPLGFDGVPTGISATNVSGGSRGMLAGKYSYRFQKNNSVTGGYGNPGERVTVTIATGEKVRFTDIPALTADDIAEGWDSWRINQNLNGGSTALNDYSYAGGPWYWVKTVYPATRTDIDASLRLSSIAGSGSDNDYDLEVLDAEIDGTLNILTFDNYEPSKAKYLATVTGYPILVSCNGKRTVTDARGDTPGPFILPAKPNNIEGFSPNAEVPTSPPEPIIGFYIATGRLYLLTPNTLQIAVFTANNVYPVATRPFWKSGFRNPYAICFINDKLYGFTATGPYRSAAEGDEGSEEHEFAADIEEKMRSWDPSKVFVIEDPVNKAACYFHAGAYKNDAGFWVTEMYPLMVRSDVWGGLQVFSSDTHDMIVSGVATVNGKLEFLCGGRDGSGGIEIKTYRIDAGSNQSVTCHLAPQFSDDGTPERPKKVKFPKVVGYLPDATFGIHGAAVGEVVDVATLEDGNAGSLSGPIAITPNTDVTIGERLDMEVSGLSVYTWMIENTWDGNGARPRVDEVVMDVVIEGSRR